MRRSKAGARPVVDPVSAKFLSSVVFTLCDARRAGYLSVAPSHDHSALQGCALSCWGRRGYYDSLLGSPEPEPRG